ncbi:MAG: hypothetical protein Q9N62_00640 [Ghiorsea sp.]|nr:hypothetical protein [Ghiorsea sp.]
MKNILSGILMLIGLLALSSIADARVLAGLIDRNGNPVHSGDEFTLHISTTVTFDLYGYRYTYDINNDSLSNQPVWWIVAFVDDAYSMVKGTSNSPWGAAAEPSPFAKEEFWAKGIRWHSDPNKVNPPPLAPGATLMGYTFVSPYPPGMIKVYAEGHTNYPWYESAPSNPDEYDLITPYGPGKVMSAIGPVKPVIGVGGVVSPYSNVTVQQCVGASCTVQVSAVGPQDPYGTAYTYTWSGAFGSVLGINPTLQLPAGTNPVTLTVSDPYGTVLTTAIMDVVVVDPNPVVIDNMTPAQAAMLTPTQLTALTPAQLASVVSLLTPTQLVLLTSNQLLGLSPTQVNAIAAWLTPSQLLVVQDVEDEGSEDEDSGSDDGSDEDSDSSDPIDYIY